MKKMLHSNLTFKAATPRELKSIGDNIPEGYVAGWASTSTLDAYDHVVEPGAFVESIKRRGLSGPMGVKFLLNHESDEMAGVIQKLEPRPQGLWMEAQMNLNVSYVRDAYEMAKMNGGVNFSVGFKLQDYEFKEDPTTNEEYVSIKRGDLMEVSVVTFPANEECMMTFVKSLDGKKELDEDPLLVVPTTIAEFQKTLVLAGFAKSRLHAKKLGAYVKLSSALFAAVTPPVIQDTVPSLMDAQKKMDTLSGVLERMKQTLAATS